MKKDKECWCACHPIKNGKPITFIHCSQCDPKIKKDNAKK